MVYRIFNIDYDLDGEVVDLPHQLIVDVPSGTHVEEVDDVLSDAISNITSFCHKGFETERLGEMKLCIDSESVNIYIELGEDIEPIHVLYYHIDEVEEDANVFISVANGIDLFHTNKNKLIQLLDIFLT
jgi:hypothetical protein